MLKSGFTEKKGKIKWSPRRLVLFGDELHCFRIEEKDSDVYPLNLIRLTQMNVAPLEKTGLRLITHQRKYEFRFETEVRGKSFFPSLFMFGFSFIFPFHLLFLFVFKNTYFFTNDRLRGMTGRRPSTSALKTRLL